MLELLLRGWIWIKLKARRFNLVFVRKGIHHQAAVEWETLKWVDWFNNRRLLGPIGYIPPAEAEERYYAQFDTLKRLAFNLIHIQPRRRSSSIRQA